MGVGLQKDYKSRIGFMQGRLIDSEKKNRIQYFPSKNWKTEFYIADKINLNLMEWTINIENIKKNPLIQKKKNQNELNFIKESNIKIESVTCDFFMQKPFFKKKFYIFKSQIFYFLKNLIKNCESLNIKYLILPLVDNSSIKSQIEENKLVADMHKLENYLNNTKILFEIDYRPSHVKRFMSKFNSNKFGINYDTGNSASLGYDIQEEIKYFRYVDNIHIKDRLFNGISVRLGRGNFKFKNFFNLLKKKNYKGNFILQTARSSSGNHIMELKKNLFFLKKFI